MSAALAMELFLGELQELEYDAMAPALSLLPHRAVLDGAANAVAATLAAPGVAMVGRPLLVRASSVANAVSLQFDDATGVRTVTFDAVGEALWLIGLTTTLWMVVSHPDIFDGGDGNLEGLGLIINSDAAAATEEDSYLRFKGGDGVAAPNNDIVTAQLKLDATAEELVFSVLRARNGGAAAKIAPILTLGDETVTADQDSTLRFRGGSGGGNVSADLRYDASADALIFENHTQFGVFGQAQARPAAYVQTYLTADRTHAARTAVGFKRAGFAFFLNPDAASTSGAADQLDLNGVAEPSAMLNVVQPDYPRNVVINFTDGDASIDAFTVDVVGFAPDGSAQAEQFTFAGGLDQVGSKIFSRVTSFTLADINGNGAADTLDVGYGSKLGLPVPSITADLVIESLTVDGAREAAAATDQVNNSVTPTTALDATVDVCVFFSYTDLVSSRVNADALDTAQLVNAIVDDLQGYGFGQ